MEEPLDPDDASEVLRRATELAMQEGGRTGGVERAALEDAATEVGIGSGPLRRALAEHDAGLLRAPDGPGGLLGPSRAVVSRTLERRPDAVRSVVRTWLKGQMMEPSERRDGTETWRRRDDLVAKVRRRVDPRRRVRLGNVDAVHLTVVPVEDRRAVVRMEADLDAMRRGLRTGVVVVPTGLTPVLGAGVAALTGEVALFVGSVPLAAALGGLGVVAGRRTLSNERDDAARVLALFLDELDDP